MFNNYNFILRWDVGWNGKGLYDKNILRRDNKLQNNKLLLLTNYILFYLYRFC